MDEAALEAWSENLIAMRQERLTLAQKELEAKGGGYSPTEFLNQASASLDQILEKWVNAEEAAWNAKLPEDPGTAIKDVRSETESVIDLELESIERDLQVLREDAKWDDDVISNANSAFQNTVNELRNKYQLKLNNFNGAMKKKAPLPPSVSTLPAGAYKPSYSGGSGGGSGSTSVIMFIVGLILGVAPSVYFWDGAKKVEKKFGSEKSKLMTEQHLIQDNYALLHDIFSQLATGKMKNLNDIEDQIRAMKSESAARKKKLDQEYVDDKEKILKKYPAGDRLDRAIEDLEYKKVQKDGDLREQEKNDLEKLEKQRKIIKDLMAG